MAIRLILRILILSMLLGCTLRGAEHTSTAETGGLHVGISYGDALLQMTDDWLDEALDDAVDIGAGWIRVDLSWADVQPTSPQAYAWGPLEHIFSEAHRRGLNVLPDLGYTPEWALVPDCSSINCAPKDPSHFAAFAAAAAARYAQNGVHTWEIWNEELGPLLAAKGRPSVLHSATASFITSNMQSGPEGLCGDGRIGDTYNGGRQPIGRR